MGFRQAATTEDSVILEWTDSSDDTGVVAYGIYEHQLLVQSSSQSSTTLTGLACGETVEIQVDALDAAGNRSPRHSAWVQTTPCEARLPSMQASAGHDRAFPACVAHLRRRHRHRRLADLGRLFRQRRRGRLRRVHERHNGRFRHLESFTQGDLVCDSLYWFGVEARDAAGNRSPRERAHVTTAACASGTDRTPPSQPTDLAVQSVTQTSVALTWGPSSDNGGVVGYDAYRNGAKMVSVPSTSITHGNLACGTSYWFGVAARDAAGNRSPRARVNATTSACATPPPPPTVPPPPPPATRRLQTRTRPPSRRTSLSRGATKTSVSLTWAASTDNVGVTGYRVYVNGTGALDPTQPGATVTALACGTAFTFEVDAADAAGNRSTRAQVTASTAACADTQAPSVPTDVVRLVADGNQHRAHLVGLERQRRRDRIRALPWGHAGRVPPRRRPGSSPG